jgi:hypothetical protein
MSREQEIRWMKQLADLVKPEAIYEIAIVEISDTNWMATVAVREGSDRRFRCQSGVLIDEATVGDARVVV